MRLENSFIFLPGIGETREQRLWQQGIRTWDALEEQPPFNGTRLKTVESLLDKARKNLDVGNSAFFNHKLPSRERWRMYGNFQQDACFFDIETTGLSKDRNKVTTVSFHQAGETTTLVRGKDLSADRLRDEFAAASILVSFNGARFDVPFLEHNFGVDIDTPHIDLMYACKRLGLTGGLKAIEHDIGIDRDLEDDLTGRDAVRLWKQYEKGDDAALETLVHYNRLDVENLQPLMEHVHRRLRADVFEPHLPDNA